MLADLAVKWVGVSGVCVVGRRGIESSFEKLQKLISADVKADVKQQEIKRTGSYLVTFHKMYLPNLNTMQCKTGL